MPPHYGVVDLETLKAESGLDFLTGIIAGRHPAPPIAETLGFRLIEVETGKAVFEGLPGRRHYNPIGSVHGGFAATLLDSCMGCAVHSTLAAGQGYTTLEFKVSLVRAITDATGPVRAEGKVIAAGRRTATADGRLVDGSGRLLAHGTTTCLLFPLE
jgi:uncharacterized protein (TIGR00369 family)